MCGTAWVLVATADRDLLHSYQSKQPSQELFPVLKSSSIPYPEGWPGVLDNNIKVGHSPLDDLFILILILGVRCIKYTTQCRQTKKTLQMEWWKQHLISIMHNRNHRRKAKTRRLWAAIPADDENSNVIVRILVVLARLEMKVICVLGKKGKDQSKYPISYEFNTQANGYWEKPIEKV